MLYTTPPFHDLPASEGTRSHARYRTHPPFDVYPRRLERVDYGPDVSVVHHDGSVPEADLTDPVAVSVSPAMHFGDTVNRGMAGENSVQEADDRGRARPEGSLAEAREYVAR